MFQLQLKTTEPVCFKKTLLPFIKSTYEVTDTKQIEAVLDRFDKLRNEAMRATIPGEASYKAILDYVKEIDYISHIPIGDKKLKFTFKWNHAYKDKSKIEGYDYHLDKISFLYNLAVLQYMEAMRQDIDTEDKIKAVGAMVKKSCSYFKAVLEMSRKRLFNISTDLDDSSVDVLYNIAETYASELMWAVALMKNTQASLCSSLAVHCYEANAMLAGMFSSETIKKEFPKSFPKIAAAKEKIFFAESNYLSGKSEYDKKNFGGALRFYTNAVEAVDEINKKKMLEGMSPSFVSLISRRLISVVKKDYDELEKDNRIIYHATVPPSASFPKSTNLIKIEEAQIPTVTLNDEQDPFANLVPVRAKALLTEYEKKSQEKVEALRNENNSYVMKTNQDIAVLGLPMSLYEVLGNECTNASESVVPGSMAEIIDDLRATGVKGMMTKHADLMAAAERNRLLIISLINDINTLYSLDNAKSAQYGRKWNSSGFRILYSDLYKELDKLQQKLGQALSTDDLLSRKIQAAAQLITVAQQYVIQTQNNSESGSDTPVVKAARNVKALLDEIHNELAKFKDYNNQLSQKLATDKPVMDFLNLCVSTRDASTKSQRFIKTTENNLNKYREEEDASKATRAVVDNLMEKLRDANTIYQNEYSTMSPTGARSEEIRDGLTKYNEIRMGMNNGLTFYTELSNRTNQLKDRIKSTMTCYNEEVRVGERNLAAGAQFVIITGMGVDPTNTDAPSDMPGSDSSSSGGMPMQQETPMEPPAVPYTQPQPQSQPQPQAPVPAPAPAPAPTMPTMPTQPQTQPMHPQQPQQQPQMMYQPYGAYTPQGQPQYSAYPPGYYGGQYPPQPMQPMAQPYPGQMPPPPPPNPYGGYQYPPGYYQPPYRP